MWKLLLLFIAALAACSEKTSSEPQLNHAKAPVTKNATDSPIHAVAKTAASIPLIRDKVSDEAKDAFINLYGGTTWKDQSISRFFGDGIEEAYVSPKFEGRFTEGGINKLLVLGYITPEPAEDYFCHACVPLIGGAVFQERESKWVIESAEKIIGWGDVFGTGEFRLVQIGTDKYGVLMHTTDAHQGYEDNRFRIFVSHKGRLSVALDAGYTEKPGPGACNAKMQEQDLSIKFDLGNNPDYFDMMVRAQYNDGSCQNWSRKEETRRYKFNNEKYE